MILSKFQILHIKSVAIHGCKWHLYSPMELTVLLVLGYSGTVMVPLGWIGGVIGLILAALVSLYVNALVANIHELGGARHIRYRDLAGYVYGMMLS